MVQNNRPDSLNGDLLALAAARAADWPHLFAGIIARYLTLNNLTEQELCARLRCDRDTLNHLRLSGRPDPDPPAFALDIQRVAGKLGLSASTLASIVREVDAAEAFSSAAQSISPFSSTPAMLQAARDREEEHGEQALDTEPETCADTKPEVAEDEPQADTDP